MKERESDEAQNESGPPGVPAWLKISGAVVAVLAIVVFVLLVVAGGEHGPGRHGANGGVRSDSTGSASAGALG
jgi:hypothetical protein